jgi:hemolysin activation/secretion protein
LWHFHCLSCSLTGCEQFILTVETKGEFMKLRLHASCIALVVAISSQASFAQDEKFDILSYDIQGATLLKSGEVDTLVAPFAGKGRTYADIQKALEALEMAYRVRGYGAVNVRVPEQEITSGVVRLSVVEAVIGKALLDGNTHFDAANIRASLPNLKEGATPNLSDISENVQLANENPAKHVEVTLTTSETPGVIDAKVRVTEENPHRFFASLDNTGTDDTGKHRLGLAYQNANLLGGDEVLTLAYTGSPDVWLGHPDNVKADVYSIAFHKPFYSIGDSLDFIYGNSNVDVPSVQNTGFGIVGKGEIAALRWNHNFPRSGEYSSKLTFGYDYKYLNSTCDPDQSGTTGSCTPYTLQPVSATYLGQFEGIDYAATYNVGVMVNLLPTGLNYAGSPGTAAAGENDHYSFITGRPVSDHFAALRFSGSYSQRVSNWMLRAAIAGQFADSALPPAEQLGLVGAMAVRGYEERAIATDTGHFVNLEAYTPNLAGSFGAPGNLHGLAFIDIGYGHNRGAKGTPFDTISLVSTGIGVRYTLRKDVSFSWDAAKVIDPGPENVGIEEQGDWRSHFKLTIGF